MQQFNEQFMTRFMLPLLGEVVTDMQKGEKNLYLGKLLKGQPLDPQPDEKEFIRYYFETREDPNRKQPFAGMNDQQIRDFREKFLKEFSGYMIMRFRLSGEEGARTAFFPDKDGNFNQETTKNLYDLAYRISLDFENERIAEMVKGDAEKERLLQEGKLKLIVVKQDGNDVELPVSEDDIAKAATSADPNERDFKLRPVVSAHLGEMKPEDIAAGLAAGAKVSKEGERRAPVAGVAGTGAAEAATGAGALGAATPQEETATAAEVQHSFGDTKKAAEDKKYEAVIQKLVDSGLTIVPGSFKNSDGSWKVEKDGNGRDRLVGRVLDRKGQLLLVRIDPKLNAADKDKCEFTFLDKDGKPMKMADGKPFTFNISENDLNDFKSGDAMQVAMKAKPEIAREKAPKPQKAGRPGVPGSKPSDLELSGIVGDRSLSKDFEVQFKHSGEPPAAMPGIPQGTQAPATAGRREGARGSTRPAGAEETERGKIISTVSGGAKPVAAAPSAKTTQEKKAEREAGGGSPYAMPRPPKMPAPGAAAVAAPAGENKQGMSNLAKAVIGAHVAVGGAVAAGTTAVVASHAGKTAAEEAAKTVMLFLHCLGLSCFS